MNYTEKDFSACLFNPMKKDLFKTYPRLTELFETGSIVHGQVLTDSGMEKMAKYILAMYDPLSPFIKEYRDIKTRKEASATLAGFNLETDDEMLSKVYSFSHPVALHGTTTFLKKFINSRLWFMITAREQTIYEYAERMLKPVTENDGDKEKDLMSAIAIKSKLSEDMSRMNELLEQDYNKFFGGDDTLQEASLKPRFTSESVAKMRKTG